MDIVVAHGFQIRTCSVSYGPRRLPVLSDAENDAAMGIFILDGWPDPSK